MLYKTIFNFPNKNNASNNNDNNKKKTCILLCSQHMIILSILNVIFYARFLIEIKIHFIYSFLRILLYLLDILPFAKRIKNMVKINVIKFFSKKNQLSRASTLYKLSNNILI